MIIIEQKRLILTEVGTNHNKYWDVELYDNGDVITKWARVGYDPQSKTFPSAGKNFMEKKISEKKKKGYTELKTVGNVVASQSSGVQVKDADLHAIAKSQLLKSSTNPTLDRLIARFIQANVHKITSSTQITYNSTTGLFATPLGIVTIDGLVEARNLLAQLAPKVRNREFGSDADVLLSRYLRLIPQSLGMGRFSTQTVIPDDNAVQKQNDLIDSLESSYQATLTAPVLPNQPAKAQEQVFKVDLDVLMDQAERARLDRFFESSKKRMHGYDNVRVKEIYKVTIHDMHNGFERNTPNIKEVFHGSSQSNALSILKSGLKVSPPSTAAIAGKMWGNGLYGALNSTKSLGYTFGRWGQSSSNDAGWLWICDFAMGNINYPTRTCSYPPKGYDSIWATVANTGLNNDELIIYRNSQCTIKYLLECK